MKKGSLILLICVAALLLACSDKNKLPKGILPQSEMQAVMWDMIRAADFLNNYVFYRQQNVDKAAESEKWNEKIFQIHHITREQFEASYKYYREHPLLMKAIMDSITRITVEQPVSKPVTDTTVATDTTKLKADTQSLQNKLKRMRKLATSRLKVE